MRVIVTSEHHLVRSRGGFYTGDKYTYEHWARLHDVFEEVSILSRASDGTPPAGHRRFDGPSVEVIVAPDFVATGGLVAALPGLARAAIKAARAGDAFILHAPGVMATALRQALRVVGKPYAIEVVGDPWESLRGSGRALDLMRGAAAVSLRAQVRHAAVSRFVARRALQERYPPRDRAPSFVASDVNIPDALFDDAPIAMGDGRRLRLVFLGMLDRPYKGLDVLLDALAGTAEPHALEVAGDGALRPALEERAARLGLSGRVRFHGVLPPGPQVLRPPARLRSPGAARRGPKASPAPCSKEWRWGCRAWGRRSAGSPSYSRSPRWSRSTTSERSGAQSIGWLLLLRSATGSVRGIGYEPENSERPNVPDGSAHFMRPSVRRAAIRADARRQISPLPPRDGR